MRVNTKKMSDKKLEKFYTREELRKKYKEAGCGGVSFQQLENPDIKSSPESSKKKFAVAMEEEFGSASFRRKGTKIDAEKFNGLMTKEFNPFPFKIIMNGECYEITEEEAKRIERPGVSERK